MGGKIIRIISWISGQPTGARKLYDSFGFRQLEDRRGLRSGQLLTRRSAGCGFCRIR
ncbi:hypothetical protein ACE3NQ_07580 [Paenibacillus terreus]|uniref:Uncharacterized protein n=1 Tax=Paenibacillus terreus TaxID=1387834 RepID=A0ABV5B4Z4_9BACL